jgi:hypothetical protein
MKKIDSSLQVNDVANKLKMEAGAPEEHAVDALPYFDGVATADIQASVRRELLVEQKSVSRDAAARIAHLPAVPTLAFEGSVFLATEFGRIRAGKPSIKFSTIRNKVGAPSDPNDVEGWEAALEAAKAELGYNEKKLVHLQLLKKYGKDAWIGYNELVGHTKELLEREQEETKISVNEVNLSRKREHEKAGARLRAMETQYWELLQRGFAVEAALDTMRKKQKTDE